MKNKPFDLSLCERNADGHYLCATRSGSPARIVAVLSCTLVVLSGDKDDPYVYLTSGSGEAFSRSSDWSLVNIPKTHTRWFNVYNPNHFGSASRQGANEVASKGRIACVEVTFTEGQGLTDSE